MTGDVVREGVEVRGETRGDPPVLHVVVVMGVLKPPKCPCIDCSWAIACKNLKYIKVKIWVNINR